MVKCPECVCFSVVFDTFSGRPTCCYCGWSPKTMPSPVINYLYELCDECWGYQELRVKNVCSKCYNEGKVLSRFTKEIVGLVQEVTGNEEEHY